MNDSASIKLNPTGKSPSHIVYHVRENIGGSTIWTQIGHVWPHDDRAGGSIHIDRAVPSSGRIVFREVWESMQ